MLSLDPTTRAEYDAAETPSARAAVVMAAITGTVTATVYDGSDVARGSGTMQTPWASIVGSRLVIGELADFMVTNGGTPDADWYLAFEAGSRWMRGSFGLSGADFNWSLATFATGQSGRLGTVEVQAQGFVPVEGPYSAQWNLMTFAQASLSPSWSVADGSAQALDASGVPNPIQINQGGTFDFADYIVGGVPPYSVALGSGSSLPLGVTKTGPTTLAAGSSAPVALSGDIVFDVDDSAVAATLPTFGVLSSVGGSNLPFAFGHVFKQGDVPSGSYVDSDLTDWQCVPTTTWPDGSLRHAIIAGRATCSAQVLRAAQLSVAGTDRAGTALTPADLAAALAAVTVQGGSQVITLNDLVATPFKTVLTGPVMSQWIFRAPVPGSNHLVVLFELRLYKGGRVELFPPKVENGYLFTAGPTNDVRTWTLTIGGVVVFSASIDIKHHAHAYLLDNSASSFKHFSYWIGGDPQIEPVHDVAYLKATKAVPNYGWTTQESTLAGLTQTYTPMWRGNVPSAMGAAGFQGHIGVLPNWQAAYLSSNADARAYRSVLANGHAAGSWSIHYRDAVTNEPPLYTDWPNASIEWGGTPSIPSGTGGTVGTEDQAHQPSMAYLPWLLTGRWYFLDEILFWNFRNYLAQSYVTREYANGLYLNEQVRSRGWNMRTLAQLLSALPDGTGALAQHPAFTSIKAAWENNVAAYEGLYVTGTRSAGAYANNLGCLGLYGGNGTSPYGTEGTHWWDAPWMQDTLILAFGHAWDLDVPQSVGAKASHLAVRNHGYKHAVGVAGPGSAGTYNWRHFGSYSMPYAADSVGVPPESWLADWGAVYAVYQQYANSGWTALPDPDPDDPNGAIYYGANPVSAGSWAVTSGVAFHYAALVMAKEHGAAGADAAWSRITGSQSWLLAPADFRATPVWSFYPRNA
jgi:hypothetical protein